MKASVERFGTIHVTIACAGITALTPTLTSRGPVDMKLFKQVMQINLMGSLYVTKYAAVQLAKNKAINDKGEKGLIILVSSN